MDLPISCRTALEELINSSSCSTADLRDAAARMTVSYKEDSGHGGRLVTNRTAVLAYAAARMPATYGAVYTALSHTLQTLDPHDTERISTVLDLGAGTGAATLAVTECLHDGISITAVEREPEMRTIGQHLTTGCNVKWVQADALEYVRTMAKDGKTFDVVISSYMTNEMSEETRTTLFSLLWQITGGILLLVEPGTKVGSAILRNARRQFLAEGADICAPCPAVGDCPIGEDDWCHFTCRVARSKLHKALKDGDVPYEDEKFSYLALTRLPHSNAANRILRHPQKDPGRITLTLCTDTGYSVRAVTKRDKASFTAARKADAGDSIEF